VGEENGQFGVKLYLLPTTRRAKKERKKKASDG
jgi:hypothetical protein